MEPFQPQMAGFSKPGKSDFTIHCILSRVIVYWENMSGFFSLGRRKRRRKKKTETKERRRRKRRRERKSRQR